MSEQFFNNDAVDFCEYILKSARETEAKGDRRAAAKSYAHAWRAGASANNLVVANLSRLELFSVSLLINDLIFTSILYRDLISTFTLDNRFHNACVHHDLGKIYRNAWEYNEIINPNEAIKHLIAAKDEFDDLAETRSSACVEMDLAHIYIQTQKLDQSISLLLSAREKWSQLNDVNGMAEAALSLGDSYTLLGKNEDAEKYFAIASEEFESAGIAHLTSNENKVN